jgi:glycosyltransferase involved in cell wall biosynthesis
MEKFCRYQRNGYDLLHANSWKSGLVASRLYRSLAIPFVITLHPGPGNDLAIQIDSVDRAIQGIKHLIVSGWSEFESERSQTTVVPFGFDSQEFWPIKKAIARMKLRLDPHEKYLLQLSAFSPLDGIEEGIRSLGWLKRKFHIDATLLVLSEPYLSAQNSEIFRLHSIVRQEGLEDQVIFLEEDDRDLMRFYYSAADFLIDSPRRDPNGIRAIEAMACGTPVIVGRTQWSDSVIRDGMTGFVLASQLDPLPISEVLAKCFRQPPLMNMLREQSARQANDLFSWRKIAVSTAEIYKTVLSSTRPSLALDLLSPLRLAAVDADGTTESEPVISEERDFAHILE